MSSATYDDGKMAFEQHARLLGYLGLVPLVVGALVAANQTAALTALEFVKNYAAVILTFIGAIHWGRAMHSSKSELVSVSVLPSLMASACLMMPSSVALPVLAVGFTLLLVLDLVLYRDIEWFRRLRIILTTLVVLILASSWMLM